MAGKHIKSFSANEYQQLFMSTAGTHIEEVLDCVQVKVTHDMNDKLVVPEVF